jgi:hypothetical protein
MSAILKGERWVAVVVVFCWMLVLAYKPTTDFIYKYQARYGNDQFIVQLDFSRSNLKPKPSIKYTRVSLVDLSGIWNAWVEEEDGPLCGGSGNGSYPIRQSGTRYFDWEYFLGIDCELPKGEYRVCSQYTLSAVDSGVKKTFGPHCTPWRVEEPPN